MRNRFVPHQTVAGALGVCLALGLGGCAAMEDLLGARRPSARVVGVRLDNISLKSATMVFDVELANPYSTPLPLVNVDYRLASGGTPFLSGEAELQGTVPAGGKKTVALPAEVRYAGLLEALRQVKPGAVIPYQAELGLSVDAPGVGPQRLPLRKAGQLPVPSVPKIELSEITWDRLGLDEASGRVRLRVVNRNQFAVELARLAGTLSLGGTDVVDVSGMQAVALEPDGGAGEVEIPISFSPSKLGMAVFRMLSGSGSGYRLRGAQTVTTPFGPMSLGFDEVGNTVFRR